MSMSAKVSENGKLGRVALAHQSRAAPIINNFTINKISRVVALRTFHVHDVAFDGLYHSDMSMLTTRHFWPRFWLGTALTYGIISALCDRKTCEVWTIWSMERGDDTASR